MSNQQQKKKLLVVDDIMINRAILTELFSDQFDVLEAENGKVALELINQYGRELAIVLLDIVMPEMDGFVVLKAMNESGIIANVPVILITGENDDENALKGYGLGVSDLVHKPFNPDVINRRVTNVVDLYSYQSNLEARLREQKEKLEEQAEKLRESQLFLIDALSTTVEFRDGESGEHTKRIRTLVDILLHKLAKYYPLDEDEIDSIANASVLHDIGKIAIPDSVLLKPGPLTKEEFEIMKTHSVRGCEILESVTTFQNEKYYTYCYEICRHHHERWDGRGYPDGLEGDDISIWAQATSLADVYDALTSKRVYKPAYSHDEAVNMILNGECGAFNPVLMEVFKEASNELGAAARAISEQAAAKEGKLPPKAIVLPGGKVDVVEPASKGEHVAK